MWGALAGLVLPQLGKMFSGGAKGSEDSRNTTNSNAITRDRTVADAIAARERAMQERAGIDIDRRKLDADTRNDGYKQSMRANYASNYQPAQRPQGVQTIRGSFNTVSPQMQQMARDYEQQATVRALQGQKFDAMPEMERFAPTPMKEPSLWEKMSGALGLGLQGAGAIAKGMQGQSEDDLGENWGL